MEPLSDGEVKLTSVIRDREGAGRIKAAGPAVTTRIEAQKDNQNSKEKESKVPQTGRESEIFLAMNSEVDEIILMALEKVPDYIGAPNLLVADSGATCHVTPYKQILTDYVVFDEPKCILTGGKTRYAQGYGLLIKQLGPKTRAQNTAIYSL